MPPLSSSTTLRMVVSLLAAALLAATATRAAAAPALIVRASGSLAGNVGPIMELRLNGSLAGRVEVRAATPTDYVFTATGLTAGTRVDVVFTNDAKVNGQDRNLQVSYLSDGSTTLLPNAPGATIDRGVGALAFDGRDVVAGQGAIYWSGALRLTWPGTSAGTAPTAAQQQAARLLQQASFGPTSADIAHVAAIGPAAWVAEQLAMPQSASYVPAVQRRFDLGANYRPGGSQYTTDWVGQTFWANAANSPDQLRKRTAFALHQIFTASLADANFWTHSRAYANHLDMLDKHAFGNYRQLLEEMALSPVMGLYLSYLRNRREDAATGVLPDENFAREVMQLFSIGLVELHGDGTPRLDAAGKPVETYTNADVMAMARVFTGWSWGYPDDQLTLQNFRWGNPVPTLAGDRKIDLQRMKAYPGQHSTAPKHLFTGKPWAQAIAADTSAHDSLRLALDALFKHPNVGPFIGRQLIQRLVTANPSPPYVARVAAAFNDNGRGVRGDLGAVVRAILLDSEARSAPAPGFGKLREPVLRVAHWMRAFQARSATGDYRMAYELHDMAQQVLWAPSVFGYDRPGYVPPNTRLADTGATAPEFQIVDESTTAAWINTAEAMAGAGLGSAGALRDVSSTLAPQASLAAAGHVNGLIQNLNGLLFAGAMSQALQLDILDAVTGVAGTDAASHLNRARVAVFVAMTSPEYLVQR